MTVPFVKPGLMCLGLIVLVACQDVGTAPSQSHGFKNSYNAARGALEAGKYARANRLYSKLLEDTGPLEPRLRLEYAHSLLRSDAFSDASQQARFVVQTQSGKIRSSAMSVLGVAEHELGLTALNAGNTNAAKLHLQTAEDALNDVLNNDPDLDPLGALAGRLASLKVRLKGL